MAPLGSRSLLAGGAKKRRTAVLRDPPDDAGAAPGRAAAAFAIIDPELVLKAPELAVGTAMIAQRGAARRNRILEHGFDGFDEPLCVRRRRTRAGRKCRSPAARRQSRPIERFARIDVAKAGHHLLIEQGSL